MNTAKVMQKALEQTAKIMITEHCVKLTLSDLCNLEDCVRNAIKTIREQQEDCMEEELLICDRLLKKLKNALK